MKFFSNSFSRFLGLTAVAAAALLAFQPQVDAKDRHHKDKPAHHSSRVVHHRANRVVHHSVARRGGHRDVVVTGHRHHHSGYAVRYANGYRGPGYYYGPPGLAYYGGGDGVVFYSSRARIPATLRINL